jgi:hypothetical protein
VELFDPARSTRRWLKLGLTVTGALAGAVFGIALTRFGKIVTGAPPATLANYAWNAAWFGGFAALVSPIVSWNGLRRAPLWRTIVEPLAYAIAGGCAAVAFGIPILILALPPAGLAFGFFRLHKRYPDPSPQLAEGAESRAELRR